MQQPESRRPLAMDANERDRLSDTCRRHVSRTAVIRVY